MQSFPLLKLGGYSSVEDLHDVFGAYLVDVGYIARVCDGYVLVSPDDPKDVQLNRASDYEWFTRVVLEALVRSGESNITASYYANDA